MLAEVRAAGPSVRRMGLFPAFYLFYCAIPLTSVPSPNCRPFCCKLALQFGVEGTLAKSMG
jgi:hypothetical protein